MAKTKTFKLGGIHPNDTKLSSFKPIEEIDLPAQIIIPLDQHLGAPAIAIVKTGDEVKTGQLIAKSNGYISANVHSSATGKVTKVDSYIDQFGVRKQAIFIKTEKEDIWADGIEDFNVRKLDVELTTEEIIQRVQDAGIVGLGGACFPTYVKLNPQAASTVDTLVINAIECEPYLTSNHRLLLEKPIEILVGTEILMKALGVTKVVIGIEDNKKNAINLMIEYAKNHKGIEIAALQTKYPQGGEKQLVQAILGTEIKSGTLPAANGVCIINVATTFACYEAVQFNKPLIDVTFTITGDELKEPSNYKARIGTPLNDAIKLSGGVPEGVCKYVGGGPMMGRAFKHTDIPISKRTSALLIMPEKLAYRKPEKDCVRCAKCVSACPMGLEPYLLASLAELNIFDELEENKIMDCIECGSCSYTCISNRPLLDFIKYGKNSVAQIIRERNIK